MDNGSDACTTDRSQCITCLHKVNQISAEMQCSCIVNLRMLFTVVRYSLNGGRQSCIYLRVTDGLEPNIDGLFHSCLPLHVHSDGPFMDIRLMSNRCPSQLSDFLVVYDLNCRRLEVDMKQVGSHGRSQSDVPLLLFEHEMVNNGLIEPIDRDHPICKRISTRLESLRSEQRTKSNVYQGRCHHFSNCFASCSFVAVVKSFSICGDETPVTTECRNGSIYAASLQLVDRQSMNTIHAMLPKYLTCTFCGSVTYDEDKLIARLKHAINKRTGFLIQLDCEQLRITAISTCNILWRSRI